MRRGAYYNEHDQFIGAVRRGDQQFGVLDLEVFRIEVVEIGLRHGVKVVPCVLRQNLQAGFSQEDFSVTKRKGPDQPIRPRGLVGRTRFELVTNGLKVRCSTN